MYIRTQKQSVWESLPVACRAASKSFWITVVLPELLCLLEMIIRKLFLLSIATLDTRYHGNQHPIKNSFHSIYYNLRRRSWVNTRARGAKWFLLIASLRHTMLIVIILMNYASNKMRACDTQFYVSHSVSQTTISRHFVSQKRRL